MSYNTSRPYLSAFIILKRGNQIALLLRTQTDWMNDHYGLPAGKVEIGERAQTAAVREAREETGVMVREADLQYAHTGHRYAQDDTLAWLDILFIAETWEGEAHNAEPHKHGELKWIDPAQLPKNMVPAIRHYLQQIAAGNHYSEFGWENQKVQT